MFQREVLAWIPIRLACLLFDTSQEGVIGMA